MAMKYVTLALGETEADLIAENEHATLRAAKADARRLIESEWKPRSVEIADQRSGDTVFSWEREAQR
jgi:hypothetical protein